MLGRGRLVTGPTYCLVSFIRSLLETWAYGERKGKEERRKEKKKVGKELRAASFQAGRGGGVHMARGYSNGQHVGIQIQAQRRGSEIPRAWKGTRAVLEFWGWNLRGEEEEGGRG